MVCVVQRQMSVQHDMNRYIRTGTITQRQRCQIKTITGPVKCELTLFCQMTGPGNDYHPLVKPQLLMPEKLNSNSTQLTQLKLNKLNSNSTQTQLKLNSNSTQTQIIQKGLKTQTQLKLNSNSTQTQLKLDKLNSNSK